MSRDEDGLQRVFEILEDRENKNGLWWYQAPLPRRWHKCSPWSSCWINLFDRVERCTCGAIRYNKGTWHEKNSRRKQ